MLEKIVLTSPAAIVIVDRDGRVVYANLQAEKVLGLEKDRITRRTYNAPAWKITGLDGKPLPDDELPFAVVRRTRQAVSAERHIIAWPDGRQVCLLINAVPLFDADGEFDGMAAALEDITEQMAVEQALRGQELSYRELFQGVSDAICIQDARGRFLEVNEGAVKMYGRPRPFFIGKILADLAAPDRNDLEKLETMFDRALAGEPQQFEFWGARGNGDIFSAQVRLYRGSYLGRDVLFALAQDISERKAVETRLLQSESRFRAVVQASPMGFHIYCLNEAGQLILFGANPAADAILDIDHETLIGKTIEQAFPALAGTDIPARYRLLAAQGGIWHAEQVSYADRQVRGVFDVYAFQAGPAAVAAMFTDVTGRKEADEALRESRQMLRLVLDTIPVRVFWKDRNLKFLGANQPFADDAGLESPEMLIGKEDAELVWAEQAPLYRRDDLAVIETGIPKLNYELPQTTPAGGQTWVRGNLVPLRDMHGEITGVLGTYVDIASDRRAEQNLQRRLKELTVLHAVAVASTRASGEDALIEQVTEIIADTFDFQDFGVLLLDPAARVLLPHPSYRGSVMQRGPWNVPLPMGVTGDVVVTGRSRRVADTSREPAYLVIEPGMRSELCVPIKIKDRVVGVINAESNTLDFFGEEDERLLQTIAGQLAIGIEKLRLFEAERARRQEADTLRQVAQVISSSLELDEVLDGLLSSLEQVVPYHSAGVFFEEKDGLHLKAFRSGDQSELFPRAALSVDNPLFDEIRRTEKPVLIDDIRADSRFADRGEADQARSWMGVPLVLRGAVAGYITLDNKSRSFFTDEMAHLALAFAYQAGVAIEHARLYEQALMASERRAVLYQASQEIARASQDPDQVYATVHRATARLMPAEAFVITILDEVLQEIETVYLFDRGERGPFRRSPAGEGLSGQVIASGCSILFDDLAGEPNAAAAQAWCAQGARAALAVPLRLGDKIIGMLSTQSYEPHAYDAEDQSLLEMLAAHAAVAIENSRLYAQTLQRLRELEVIDRISTALRVAENLQDMLPGLLDETLELMGTGSGAIELYDPSASLLKTVVERGWFAQISRISLKPGEGIAGAAFESGQAILVREFASDPRTWDANRPRIPPGWGGICLPIRSDQAAVGVMFISVRLPRQISAEEARLLGTISEMTGNAVRRAVLYEQTGRQLQRLASLRAIDMAISSILDVRVTLGILLDHITAQLGVDAVDILLLNQRSQALEYAAGAGFRTDAIQRTLLHMNDGLPGHVLQQRAIVLVHDLAENPHFNKRSQILAGEGFVCYVGAPLIAKGQVKGVIEIFHRAPLDLDAEWRGFLETLAGQAAIAIDNAALFEELQRTNLDLSLAYDATIEGWSKALDLRDKETEGHTRRVVDMTLQLARAMAVSEDEMIHIRRGALLHDIGKMGIPDKILHKTGALSETEWEIMRQHPAFAYDMLYPISYLRLAINIPYCHHERWDGAGYPRGLKGEQIPLAARIFAVVDVWDAIISDRPYRKAWTPEEALVYIREQAGTHFDPRVAETFLHIFESGG